MTDLAQWCRERLGHDFRDLGLVEQALTHRSLGVPNYERLEFLGDRVLGFVIAAHLYVRYPCEGEGELTRRFHQLVSRQTCAAIARRLGVPEVVRLNAQARADGGADSDNILGDVVEALIGALFVDGGEACARAFIHHAWASRMGEAPQGLKHPKSALQEWALARGLGMPTYTLVARSGPHHAPKFLVRLELAQHPPIEATGSSKQDAETEAARQFLERHANAPA
ncbi:MAG: ribonuclease III [Sphingomonadaceae bacterium]|uniref:ribonuclease III n=1 Tax=Thermaurantiacus sp. TaxID=2820283 RepID=UPI00298F25F6|nr:ribonuclease III [Thermaurantiacus sp.]MCS6987706.1 ribonuclease III [Sphingomonadaceae bacterium]MDW8415075.1 ribonuclease III [Thermaurantiacus sp.]